MSNGNGAVAAGKTLGAALKAGGAWVLSSVALLVVGAVTVWPNARADAFTGTDAREMKQEILAAFSHLEDRLETHEALPYHTQAGVSLSDVQAQLRALSANVAEVKADVKDIQKELRGGD